MRNLPLEEPSGSVTRPVEEIAVACSLGMYVSTNHALMSACSTAAMDKTFSSFMDATPDLVTCYILNITFSGTDPCHV